MNTSKPLVVNWHFTEACNYSCTFCFAKYDRPGIQRELFHSRPDVQQLVHSLHQHFNENGKQILRLNLAGGEPFLYPDAMRYIVDHATDLGMSVSCITNGSRLSELVIREFAPALSVFGVSVDSTHRQTNSRIGREDNRGQVDLEQLVQWIQIARDCNPVLQTKVNTVVSRLNHLEDMSDFIRQVVPDKWKLFQVLPVVTKKLDITRDEFMAFADRHADFDSIMVVEDNRAMTHSYLMIDPYGRFCQNRESAPGLDRSDPILEVGVEKALSQIAFDEERFLRRY